MKKFIKVKLEGTFRNEPIYTYVNIDNISSFYDSEPSSGRKGTHIILLNDTSIYTESQVGDIECLIREAQ